MLPFYLALSLPMTHFVCINSNNYCGRGKQYVEILRDSIFRNISEGTTAKFTVFTDDLEDYPDIHKRPFPNPELKGWWHKLSLFKPGLFEDDERIVYLDLDTVIFGPLDEIIKYDGKFAILSDFQAMGYNSSVMAWKAGECTEIWESYERAWFPEIDGGDQSWIERTYKNPDYLQILYPDKFVSYKAKCKYGPPRGVSVVVFHGEPRPHEVKDTWVENVWKLGGQSSAVMPQVCNTSEEQIIKNVRHALMLGLPTINQEEANEKFAVLIGGGPSLKDNLDKIKFHQDQGHIIFATNRTFKYLKENGIQPNFHVMLDARPGNADFIDDGVGLYASQCDHEVFAKAVNPVMWHTMECSSIVPDEGIFIGFGSTVGLKSIALAHVLGYRKIHLYGYDSCYSQESHHAYEQQFNDGERIIDVQVGDRIFKCAPWMATQADEFTIFVPELLKIGCEITVNGTGLIPYIAKLMASGEITPKKAPDQRATAVLDRLNGGSLVGVEVGVYTGELSKRLLTRQDLILYMVDSWVEHDKDCEYAKSDYHGKLSQAKQDELYEKSLRAVSFAGERAKIIRKSSLEAAKDFEDGSLDFVFIDADHTYDATKADIAAWGPKVKKGGLLCGHDYENYSHPEWGVTKAVNEIGIPVDKGLNFTWFVRL